MIKLRDGILIRAAPERIFHWLCSLPQEYVSWHPDHAACRILKGSMDQAGSEIECREYLHGKLHVMRFRLTAIDPGRRMEYKIAGLGRGAFEVVPQGRGVEFVAELELGTNAPVIGQAVDTLLHAGFSRRLAAMKEHMREEGENLKKIIESGWEQTPVRG